MAPSVKVSTKYQISVPSEVRRRLGIEAGDRLTVAVRDDEIVLRRRPARASERLRGIARGRGWYEPDPVAFIRNLRDEWEEEVRERERRWAAESGSPAGSPPRRHRRERADRPVRGSDPAR